jgi:F420-0:gamma-glutamyl ligase
MKILCPLPSLSERVIQDQAAWNKDIIRAGLPSPEGIERMGMAEYVGTCAFGLKMGVVLPGADLIGLIMERIEAVNNDGLLDDFDVLCVTESLVARTQKNYVTVDEIAEEVRSRMRLEKNGKLGVLFPIVSRNRFSLILEGIACAVAEGEVIVQLSYPRDEVGNQIMTDEEAEVITGHGGCVHSQEMDASYRHPITGVDYVRLYRDIIAKCGARPTILLCNDPMRILDTNPDAVIVSDIHTREQNLKKIRAGLSNSCTLQDFFGRDEGNGKAWSEFGLLGSNMSSSGRLKLAPRSADAFATGLQKVVQMKTGRKVEVIVNGDGAYKDPTSSIYELADPRPALGSTPGVRSVCREGVKYKYLVDLNHDQGKSCEEIEQALLAEKARKKQQDDASCEGTTPRRMEDVLASLADLVSGSADAGTPLVLIKGIYQP